MQDVYFYTPEFELLHIESKVTSIQWGLRYADTGTLELHTDTKNDVVGKVLPHTQNDVIVVQDGNAAWVHGITDMDGNYDFGVFGKTLKLHVKLESR